MAKVIIDAGHGGREPGAIYGDRKEKDDTLRLALAVGEILKQNGVDVAFTRTEDVYNSPFEKAQTANREGGDFLISIHRMPVRNQISILAWNRWYLTGPGKRWSLRKISTGSWRRPGTGILGSRSVRDL